MNEKTNNTGGPPGSGPNQLADYVDRNFESVAEWSIRHRWKIAVFILALLGYGLYCLTHVRFDNSLGNFFYKDDPAYITYNEYLDDFVSDEVVYLMYSAEGKEHGPFNLEVMTVIANLTETLEREVPFARKATSLANVEFMRPMGEDFIEIDELLADFPESQEALLQSKALIMNKPIYRNYLINDRADHAAIIVQMEATSTDSLDEILIDPSKPTSKYNAYPTASDAKVEEILARPEFADQGIRFYRSGDVPMNTAYIGAMINDMTYITLAALALIVLLGLVIFRATLPGIFGPLTVVIISVILTVAFIWTADWTVGNFFSLLPTLVIAVGIAQSVHILLEYQRQLSVCGERNLAIAGAMKKVGGPCMMAALTTAAGFAVMGVSDLKMLAEFGFYSAFGVLATFVLSATLLVIVLSGKPRKSDMEKTGKMAVHPAIFPIVEKSIELNIKHPNKILAVFIALFVLAAAGATQLRNDFNFLSEFKPHIQWRQDTLKVEEEMGGTLRMSYLVDTHKENGIQDPQLIKHIEKIQRFAEKNPLVKKTQSIADLIKDVNQTFNANDPAFYTVPDEKDLLAQYLLVYDCQAPRAARPESGYYG